MTAAGRNSGSYHDSHNNKPTGNYSCNYGIHHADDYDDNYHGYDCCANSTNDNSSRAAEHCGQQYSKSADGVLG